MASVGLNGASIALSVVSLAFFVVGCIGYSDEGKVLKSVAWITSDNNGLDTYFGLRSVYVYIDLLDSDAIRDYDDDACTFKFCDKCEKNGQAAFGLTVIATVFTAIAFALSAASLAAFNKGIQVANIFMAFIAAAASLVGVGLFMGKCYKELDNAFSDGTNGLDLEWGPGAVLTLIGMLLMWIVVIFQIAAAGVGGGE